MGQIIGVNYLYWTLRGQIIHLYYLFRHVKVQIIGIYYLYFVFNKQITGDFQSKIAKFLSIANNIICAIEVKQ